VAATESVGRRRRERNDVSGRRAGLLGRRSAARGPWAGVDLVGRRNVKHGGVHLGRGPGEAGSWRGRRVRQLVLEIAVVLLEARVHDVLVLASELVEDDVQTRLSSLLDCWGVLELLLVRVHLGRVLTGTVLLLLTHATTNVHVAELLRSKSQQLLLKLLLPLSKVELGGQQLSGNVGVHLAIIVLNGRRSEDLVVNVGLLVVLIGLVGSSEAVPNGSLRSTLVGTVLLGETVGVAHVVLALVVGSRGRRLSRIGRLGGSTETGQKVGAAGTGGGDRVLGDGANLGRRSKTETLESGTLASRSETRGGHADAALGLEVVVCHLSKTASVHAHCGGLERLRTKSKAATKKVCGAHVKG